MPIPPLWKDSVDLADSVLAIAEQAGLSPAEKQAALFLLSRMIADGERSFVKCLMAISQVIENERPRLAEMALRYAVEPAAATSNATGTKPATPQQEIRWDLQRE